jgi:hypothetical protein
MLPASLATPSSGARQIIGCASMDPGLSTQLDGMETDKCRAGAFTIIVWIVQALTTLYAVFFASIVWADDAALAAQPVWLQFPQLLAALNINRGTWALAVLGCLVPFGRRWWLYASTGIAVALDLLFILRAFLLAIRLSDISNIAEWIVVIAYLFPALEAFVFVMGRCLYFVFHGIAFAN